MKSVCDKRVFFSLDLVSLVCFYVAAKKKNEIKWYVALAFIDTEKKKEKFTGGEEAALGIAFSYTSTYTNTRIPLYLQIFRRIKILPLDGVIITSLL